MKIAFFEIKPEEKSFFEQNLKEHELCFFEKPVNEYEGVFDFDVISVFIHSKIDKDTLKHFPNIKYIQTRSTGVDHLDLEEIYKKGLIASNVAGYAGPAVGEFSFSLLFEAIRKTYLAINRLKEGNLYYADLKGTEIAGKTVGVLGLGTIGEYIAKLALGFNARVIGFNRSKKEIEGVEYTDKLKYVLEHSDFLFIALPLTKSTKDMINKDTVKLFKGNVIINPARAEIISKDVYESYGGIIAADVLPDWNLAKKQNIIATPHMAYYTSEALERILKISLENIKDFLNGKKPRNCLKTFCEKENLCIKK